MCDGSALVSEHVSRLSSLGYQCGGLDAVMALPMNGESEGEKPLATNRRVLAIVVVADTLLSIAVSPIRKSNPISIRDNPR